MSTGITKPTPESQRKKNLSVLQYREKGKGMEVVTQLALRKLINFLMILEVKK